MITGQTVTAGCTVKLKDLERPAKVTFAAQPNTVCSYTNPKTNEESKRTMPNVLFFHIDGDNERIYRAEDIA